VPSEKRMRTSSVLVSFSRALRSCTLRNSRWLTGKVTYIGSRLTMTVSGPLSGLTTLPRVNSERPISPVIGATICV